MSTIKEIIIDLEEWTEHYPTGAIIYFKDGSEDSDYCDNAEEFKEFLGRHKDDIKNSLDANVVIRMNLYDIDVSTVTDVAKEVQDYICSLIRP